MDIAKPPSAAPVPHGVVRANLGTFLLIGDNGEPRLHSAYYRERVPDEQDGGATEAERPRSQAEVGAEARHPAEPVVGFETPDAPATIALARLGEALDRSWTAVSTRAGRFDAFRALSDEARAAWLAHAVAGTLEVSLGGGNDGGCAFHDHLAQLLGVDLASWWRPRASTWFDRVPKALAVEALAEVGGPAFAARYAKAKKAELSEACERIFAGDFVGGVGIKRAALAWVPEAMRFGAPSAGDHAAPEAGDPQAPSWDEELGGKSGGSAIGERIEEPA